MVTSYFIGGENGTWSVSNLVAVAGEDLPLVKALTIAASGTTDPLSTWTLRGFSSNIRYTERSELTSLQRLQSSLGRQEASCAVMIPIKKNDAWWALAQDERRSIFEESSKHIQIGLKYIPAIARKLYHSRDLGEPFDFITWFEFEKKYTASFTTMLTELRATNEWSFVEREVEVWLTRM